MSDLASWVELGRKCFTSVGVVWLAIDRIWEKVKPVEEFLERRITERRHNNMSVFSGVIKFISEYNPATIIADISKAGKAAKDAQAALVQLPPLLADLKQAYTDKSDTTKLELDIAKLIGDATIAANNLAPLFADL